MHFGITPLNFGDYSPSELNVYISAIADMNRR